MKMLITFPTLLVLLQKLLGLVHLRRQIRATASVWMVQEHELPMVLPYFILGERPFTLVNMSAIFLRQIGQGIYLS